jgi:hypothetical protein
MNEASRPDPPPEGQEPRPARQEPDQPLSPRLQRDLEIDQIRMHSRYRLPGIQRPPELPPASPRRAILVAARWRRERALVRDTERQAVPTVAVVHPVLEPAQELDQARAERRQAQADLDAADRLVVNPPDSLEDGQTVNVVEAPR